MAQMVVQLVGGQARILLPAQAALDPHLGRFPSVSRPSVLSVGLSLSKAVACHPHGYELIGQVLLPQIAWMLPHRKYLAVPATGAVPRVPCPPPRIRRPRNCPCVTPEFAFEWVRALAGGAPFRQTATPASLTDRVPFPDDTPSSPCKAGIPAQRASLLRQMW